jgi:branched-chain amino acid aminotransferase
MTNLFHVDGELVPAEDATVSVRDRGFMYGDAGFETLRVYGGEIFEWDHHLRRLKETCKTLGFGSAFPAAETLRERIDETLAANDLTDAYVRLSVTRGVQPGKLTPGEDVDPTVVVIVSELPQSGKSGTTVWDGPAVVESVETRKIPHEAIPASVKTHNYLNGILGRLEADGADEVLFESTEGFITEGATSNVFFVRDGTLCTPTTELPLLPGVTRAVVLDLAREADIPVETGRYDPAVFETAQSVFLTNSTWEIRPVSALSEWTFEPGQVTRELRELFDERVESCYRDS